MSGSAPRRAPAKRPLGTRFRAALLSVGAIAATCCARRGADLPSAAVAPPSAVATAEGPAPGAPALADDEQLELEALRELLLRRPDEATASVRLRLALLEGDLGDLDAAITLGESALEELPSDATRLHALRRVARLHGRRGDHDAERRLVVEALGLARTLSEARATRELEALLRHLDRPRR